MQASPRSERRQADAGAIWRNPWWGVVALAITVGGWVTRNELRAAAVERQLTAVADTTATLQEIRRDIRDLKTAVDSLAVRQRDFFCANRERYCR